MTDAEKVAAYMNALQHPLKAEMDALRVIIKGTDSRIAERIKWNAPSYYYKEDMLTFNHRMQDKVHLIFHHPFIEQIQSPLLEGDYKGRRMAYFADMDAVKAHEREVQRIIKELIEEVESRKPSTS